VLYESPTMAPVKCDRCGCAARPSARLAGGEELVGMPHGWEYVGDELVCYGCLRIEGQCPDCPHLAEEHTKQGCLVCDCTRNKWDCFGDAA
jgi:hypothetical protein